MSQKLLRSFLFGLSLFVGAETKAQYFPDTTWTKCYGGTDNDRGNDIIQTFDGGFVALGFSSSTDGDLAGEPAGTKSWVIKLDSLGNIEWQRTFADQYASTIRQTTDSGYLMGGYSLLKLKQDGSTDWQTNDTSWYAMQTYDGGYALYTDGQLKKLSDALALEWAYDYKVNVNSKQYYGYSGFEQTQDSGFVFGGSWQDLVNPDDIRGSWIVKTDKNGITEMNKEGDDLKYYYVVKQAMDGNYLIGGAYQAGVTIPPDYAIIKCDTGEIWYESTWERNPHDVIENVDTTLVDVGDVPGTAYTNGYLVKRQPGGLSIISLEYGGSDYDYFQKVIFTRDSGYIVIGATNSNDQWIWGNHGNYDLWIMRFNKDTSVHVPPPVVTGVATTISKIDEVKVYPTLTKGDVYVALPQGYQKAEIRLLDITGKNVLFRTSGNGSKRSIHINDAVSGQYILQVGIGGEWKSFKVTVE